MGSFSFKSSGGTVAAAAAARATAPTPIGIVTPLKLGTSDLLLTTTDLATQLGDNLRNLIQTNWGERLGLYSFGANLRPLMANISSQDDFDSQAIVLIKSAVQRWMPYIDLDSFSSTVVSTGKLTPGLAQVQLTISYNIPSLNVTGRLIQVNLFAI